mmetsp:Transcript_7014/g.22519  ORF Transcript_7014/g.22519 Transcript_7014/m.22519 type:complete len:216 (-) Transcript_7014:502-1149(-)
MRLHLLHCVHLSMSTRGTWMAMPRFSNWEVPKGTRPPGSKVLTGRSPPLRPLQGPWIFSANSAAAAMAAFLGAALTARTRGVGSNASAQASGTGTSTMPPRLASTPAIFICTTLSPFFPYIFWMLFLSKSTASSMSMTPLSLKKTVCMIMLMRLPMPTSTPILVASMTYSLALLRASSRRIMAGSCTPTSSPDHVQLMTTVPPGFKYFVMSYWCT